MTKALTFLVERSTLGQDEIDARRGKPGGARVPEAFRLVVDGFTAAELGLTSGADAIGVASPVNGMSIICTGNTAALGNYGAAVQRFTFHYLLDFGGDDTAFSFATDTLTATISATAGGITAFADLKLIKQPNPFILHGDPPWLSIDLRVFKIRANVSRFGITMGSRRVRCAVVHPAGDRRADCRKGQRQWRYVRGHRPERTRLRADASADRPRRRGGVQLRDRPGSLHRADRRRKRAAVLPPVPGADQRRQPTTRRRPTVALRRTRTAIRSRSPASEAANM